MSVCWMNGHSVLLRHVGAWRGPPGHKAGPTAHGFLASQACSVLLICSLLSSLLALQTRTPPGSLGAPWLARVPSWLWAMGLHGTCHCKSCPCTKTLTRAVQWSWATALPLIMVALAPNTKDYLPIAAVASRWQRMTVPSCKTGI